MLGPVLTRCRSSMLSQFIILPPYEVPLVMLLYALVSMCNATGVVISTSATNMCAARHHSRKGLINGVAATLESIGKAVGPVSGATLFAVSLEGVPGPGALRGAAAFFAFFALAVAAAYLAIGLSLRASPIFRTERSTERSSGSRPPTADRNAPDAATVERECATHPALPSSQSCCSATTSTSDGDPTCGLPLDRERV